MALTARGFSARAPCRETLGQGGGITSISGWLGGFGGREGRGKLIGSQPHVREPIVLWGQGGGIMSISGWLGGFGGREGLGKLIGSQPHVREPIVLWGQGGGIMSISGWLGGIWGAGGAGQIDRFTTTCP